MRVIVVGATGVIGSAVADALADRGHEILGASRRGGERNHQGKDNLLLFPRDEVSTTGRVRCRERLGGLLKFYYQAAA